MKQIHVNNKTGEVGVCGAEKGQCPFGDASQHFSSAKGAREHYEKTMSEREVAHNESRVELLNALSLLSDPKTSPTNLIVSTPLGIGTVNEILKQVDSSKSAFIAGKNLTPGSLALPILQNEKMRYIIGEEIGKAEILIVDEASTVSREAANLLNEIITERTIEGEELGYLKHVIIINQHIGDEDESFLVDTAQDYRTVRVNR